MAVAPPFPRLPALNALRAFEAAARLGGFAAAAEELRVTPGAIAAHVKSLEDELGAMLFVRHSRGVRLTELGRRALPGFVTAFDGIAQAVRDLRHEAAPQKLHIAALPAVAQLWLAPRLPLLAGRWPEMDISISAVETPPNLKRTPFDLCVFFTGRPPRGSRILATDTLLPVCAPALAARLTEPRDLERVVCISDSSWAGDWSAWAQAAMPGRVFAPRGPSYSLYSLAVSQAIGGAGVLMGHRALVERHLADGTLVAPFPIEVPLDVKLAAWMPDGNRPGTTAGRVLEALSGGVG